MNRKVRRKAVIQIEAAICVPNASGEVEHLVGLCTLERDTIYNLPNGPGITMLLSVPSGERGMSAFAAAKTGWLGE